MFFMIIGVLLISCKKKQSIHITAKNVVTGEPYGGLHYTVTRVKTGMFESHYKTVASGTLNQEGEAYVTKRLTKEASYDVGIEDPGNICYVNQASFTFADGDDFEANFEFAECGYLKLSINNTSCVNDSDKISVYRKLLSIPNHETWSATHPYIQQGCEQTISPSYFSVIMGKYHFWWKVTKNNVTNTYNDTIYIQAGEYKTYTINY